MSGIALEVMPDAGAPQVGITIDGLDAVSSSVITVEVSWDAGETWNGVRGASAITVTGGTFIRDHVPALNIESTYRLTVVSGATVPATLEATITPTSSTAWIQDPLDPHSAVAVGSVYDSGSLTLLSSTAASIVRSQPFDAISVLGDPLVTASIGTRLTAASIPLALYGLPASQGALITSLRALFASAGQLAIRGLPTYVPVDPVAHVIAGDVTESPVVDGVLGTRNDWTMTLVQTRPSSLRIVIPWWTYDQVKALWSGYTYADATSARPSDTYLDWLRDPTVP
jgi:hypothetical protein